MNLMQFANEFDSDKGTTGGRTPHRYTYLYDLLFYPMKDQPINFLEIGLCRGGPELGGDVDRLAYSPSVDMWKRYFSKATIFGFDISEFSHQQDDRFTFFRGDSGKPEDLARLAASVPDLDVIIEDASHASYHQQMAVLHLWDKLKPGGYFIIEDLNWQPPAYEEKLPKVPTTTELFLDRFEGEERMTSVLLSDEKLSQIKRETQAASFFPNFNPFSSSKIKLLVLAKTR